MRASCPAPAELTLKIGAQVLCQRANAVPCPPQGCLWLLRVAVVVRAAGRCYHQRDDARAQVMLTKTIDTEAGLVNGARGVVTKFLATRNPSVRFDK